MAEINLKCACGKVQGKTEHIDSKIGNRMICCCDDCQSFAQYLKQEDTILDQFGGTDIFILPITHLKITQGNDQVACIRLSAKGMFRWYTKCCNTPIANTMGANMSFIGLIHSFMDNSLTHDEDLGLPRAYLQSKYAKKEVIQKTNAAFKTTSRMIFKILIWKLKGLNTPSAFFDKKGDPITKPIVLNEK